MLSYLLNVAQVIVSDGLRVQVVVVQRIADLALWTEPEKALHR